MISCEETKKIAKLARIYFESEELESLRKDLSMMLEYFTKIQKLDTEKVEPTFNVIGILNVLREDKAENYNEHEKLVERATYHEGNLVKVRSILQNED